MEGGKESMEVVWRVQLGLLKVKEEASRCLVWDWVNNLEYLAYVSGGCKCR